MIKFKIGPTLRQYISVVLANFTFFQVGVHIGWASPLLIQLKDEKQTIFPEMITDVQAAWLLSIADLVGLSGLLFAGFLADRIGRKYTIILGYLPRLVTCLIFLVAKDIRMLVLARAIGGLSNVFSCCVTSTYTSEIASKEIRGGLGITAQLMSSLGSMIILCIGPYLDYMTLAIIISCATVVTFIPLIFLTESPYFLYAKGRVNESTEVLTLLRKKDSIEDELKEYSVNIKANVNVSKYAVLKDSIWLKTCVKVMIVAIGSQMTGFNAVLYYLQTIFKSTHTTVSPEISSVIIGCIQILACCVTYALTDRFGRKPILSVSLVGSIIGLIGMGTFFKLIDLHYEIVGFLNYIPLISITLVIFFYNSGVGATIWTLSAELFDGPSRAAGMSFVVFIYIGFTFLTTRFFSSVTMAIGPAATYWMFAACSIVTCLFIIFFIPETNGKTFSEIQKELGRINMTFEENDTKEKQKVEDFNG